MRSRELYSFALLPLLIKRDQPEPWRLISGGIPSPDLSILLPTPSPSEQFDSFLLFIYFFSFPRPVYYGAAVALFHMHDALYVQPLDAWGAGASLVLFFASACVFSTKATALPTDSFAHRCQRRYIMHWSSPLPPDLMYTTPPADLRYAHINRFPLHRIS